jgi:hypothetical protein
LSHGDSGIAYGIGTLASEIMLIVSGRAIDHIDLRPCLTSAPLGQIGCFS